jgi:hypothetical protein
MGIEWGETQRARERKRKKRNPKKKINERGRLIKKERKKSQFSLLFLVSRVGERIGVYFGRIKSQFSKEAFNFQRKLLKRIADPFQGSF